MDTESSLGTAEKNIQKGPGSGPEIYVPALPFLDSLHLKEARAITNARFSLLDRLHEAGYYVFDIFGVKPVWAANIDKVMARIDGVLFPPMTALLEDPPEKRVPGQETAVTRVRAQRLFEFLSVATSMHVGDRAAFRKGGDPNREIVSKPCVAIDADGLWSSVVQMLRGLKAKGAFSTNVDDIVSIVAPEDMDKKPNLKSLNARAMMELNRRFEVNHGKKMREVPKEWPEDYQFTSFRKDRGLPRSEFGVIAFGSATMTHETFQSEGRKFGEGVGRRGLRLITGAGKNSMMGAFAEGFDVGARYFRSQYPNHPDPAHIGISTNEILSLEGPPVAAQYKERKDLTPEQLKEYSLLDQLVVVKNRGDRLLAFFEGNGSAKAEERIGGEARVATVFPGGIGSLEEFATMMQMKLHGSMMEDTEIHLINLDGYYNDLVDLCEKAGVSYWFKVYTTVEESLGRIDDLKQIHELNTGTDRNAMERMHAAAHRAQTQGNPGYTF